MGKYNNKKANAILAFFFSPGFADYYTYLLMKTSSTGYGQHGDYLFGWKDDSLQKAMDALPSGKCANANCQVLKIQSAQDAIKCKKAQQVVEDVGVSGDWLTELPGGMPVTY